LCPHKYVQEREEEEGVRKTREEDDSRDAEVQGVRIHGGRGRGGASIDLLPKCFPHCPTLFHNFRLRNFRVVQLNLRGSRGRVKNGRKKKERKRE
jgi:hypothetical protein